MNKQLYKLLTNELVSFDFNGFEFDCDHCGRKNQYTLIDVIETFGKEEFSEIDYNDCTVVIKFLCLHCNQFTLKKINYKFNFNIVLKEVDSANV